MVMRLCALALCAVVFPSIVAIATAQPRWSTATGTNPVVLTSWADPSSGGTHYGGTAVPAAVDVGAWDGSPQPQSRQLTQATPPGDDWIAAPADRFAGGGDEAYFTDSPWGHRPFGGGPSSSWTLQVLPEGLIYRSYWAGVHEPRLALNMFSERDGHEYWDGTLGGRVGLWRYGTCDPIFPQGWQLDVEAAAIARLDLDEVRDMESVDYRAGVPLTYGVNNWQFKFGYYHLSSHLADEFAINHSGSLDERTNYVRDALVLGASYYPHPYWRIYAEVAYAFFADGGAEPWEFQFGTEWSRPGPTGPHGTPFAAFNGHLREEHDFGGDVSTQAGWLWRGNSGQTMRVGAFYFNGKSSQYQFFDDSEQQVGLGLWYDF